MNLPLFIAKRYFLSKKKKNFINVISLLSMGGVAFGTMALVVVLSVFNGLEDLIRSLYNSFDPQIKVSVIKGKTFEVDSAFLKKIKNVPEVEIITEVIEDWAHVEYNKNEKLVIVKGVSPNFTQHHRMDSVIVDGELILKQGEVNYSLIGRGVQQELGISLYNELGTMSLRYPRKIEGTEDNHDLMNIKKRYDETPLHIKASSVFAIEKQYDDKYIFVPLDFAQKLTGFKNHRTSLEIKTKNGSDIDAVRDELKKILGPNFSVLNSDEQHASLLKAIKIEKLFVYITFSFILAIASLNIFFSLTMLAIEKKKDVAVLSSIGASGNFIKKLFMFEGFIIAGVGASLGLLLGISLCWIQQKFGFISMGMETSIVDAYPVKMEPMDFVFTGIAIFVITIFISYRPALNASKFNLLENLK